MSVKCLINIRLHIESFWWVWKFDNQKDILDQTLKLWVKRSKQNSCLLLRYLVLSQNYDQRFLPARIFSSKVTKNQIPIFMTVQLFGYFLKFLSCYEFWHLVLGYFWAGWLRSLTMTMIVLQSNYCKSVDLENLTAILNTRWYLKERAYDLKDYTFTKNLAFDPISYQMRWWAPPFPISKFFFINKA